MGSWEIVDDGDQEFTGPYDVWIELPDEDIQGGTIIGACYREHAALISAAPDLLDAAKQAFYREVGILLAGQVEDAGWVWPEKAPHTVTILAEGLRSAIHKATRHVPD